MYLRALPVLAAHLGCEPTEEAVFAARSAADPAAFLRATGTELLLLDDGFPPPEDSVSREEMGALAGCEARAVLRIERLGPSTPCAPRSRRPVPTATSR